MHPTQLLQTPRLLLTPFTHDLMLALLNSRQAFMSLYGARVPDSWPGPDLQEALPFISEATQGAAIPWTRLIIHSDSNTLIGDIGFIGPPSDSGAVELGYSIISDYQGKGYATEAVQALSRWVLRQPGVSRIIAECLSDNIASRRVREKSGFSLVIESGETLHWEKKG